MKVEVNLTLVKGQCASGAGPRKTSRKDSSPGIVLLITQENQQARRLDLSSLTEARTLLATVNRRLSETPGEVLSGVHLLDSSCLVRLP